MFVKLETIEEAQEVTCISATAVEIQPMYISKVVESTKMFEIPQHLKRIKKTESGFMCLIKLGINNKDDILREVGATNDIYPILSTSNFLNVKVPQHPPCTSHQYSIARDIWPCNYTNVFNEPIDQQLALRHMLVLVNKAYYLHFIDKSQYLEYLRKLNLELEKSVLSCDDQNSIADKLIKKSKIIDNVSETEDIVECCGICLISDKEEILSLKSDKSEVLGHSILRSISLISKSKRGYLCTDYSAFLLREPCVSCSMALVHGRIKNVFCLIKSDSPHSSFSGLKLNYNKNTNHRFNVYFFLSNKSNS